MTYIRKKTINGKTYLYEQESKRIGNKVITKHIRYIGKESKGSINPYSDKLNKTEIKEYKNFKIELVETARNYEAWIRNNKNKNIEQITGRTKQESLKIAKSLINTGYLNQ